MNDYARKVSGPQKSVAVRDTFAGSVQTAPNVVSGGACEWDRLMAERSELIDSGCYQADDPLIREIDRQITAAKLKSGAAN